MTLNYPKSTVMGFFSKGTQERVWNSRGKRAIRVRALKVLLYYICKEKKTYLYATVDEHNQHLTDIEYTACKFFLFALTPEIHHLHNV